MEIQPVSKNQMIRELEQIQLLLENINGNLLVKTSKNHDFRKKNPSLKQSKKEVEQENFFLRYISNHLTPETKTKKEPTDLKKKSRSFTQSLIEIEQEKILLHSINNQLMTKDSTYKDILDNLTTEFKTPLIPIMAHSNSLLEGEFGDLSQTQKEKLKIINKNTNLLLDMISELLVSKNVNKVKKMFSPEKLLGSLSKIISKNQQIMEQHDILHFTEQIKSYPVGIIDIVGSTNITFNLSDKMIGDYYGIFINDIGNIIQKFDGIVVKNIGDSLLFYFPDTLEKSHQNANQKSFENAIKCGFAIIDHHSKINKKTSKLGLPKLDYKISFSYGKVRVAKIATSAVDDIFGPAVNLCAKINALCPPNSIVVTQKLHDELVSFDWQQSEALCEYCLTDSKVQLYLIKKTV